MLQLIRKAKGNENFPHRPGDIAGKTLLDKIDFVADINKKSRIQLKKYATTKLAGQPITLDDVFQSFASGLDDLGVEIIEKKGGKIAVDFSGARLGSKDNKPIKEVVNYMVARMNKGKLDAREAHWLKQKIDNNIPWDATNKMSSQGENLLKSFRRDINEQLRASFDGYKALNEVVGETTDALKEVRKATGIKVDIESPYASAALGQESRKLMTNYKSRSVLESSIDKIEAAASKHGLDTQESVKAQARFVTQLEDLFGESAKGGFRAETRKATRDALRDAATGNRAGTIGRAIDSTLDAATGVSQKAQFEVIEKLLAR
ncbi:MAG: hypothetical protein GY938_32665 [Ketobacter sp.]|nr:hypothetical protein [Ketobacter sp.]